ADVEDRGRLVEVDCRAAGRGGRVAGLIADRGVGRKCDTLTGDRAVGGATAVACDTRKAVTAGPANRHVALVPASRVGAAGGSAAQRRRGAVNLDTADRGWLAH